MRMVSNAGQAFRWFSVQAMAVAGALQGAWVMVPDDLKARVPSDLVDVLTVGILVLGIFGRLVDQGGGNA